MGIARTEKETPLMKQTGGGTKTERSEKNDGGGRDKRLDIWLLEFNKTLKERNDDKTEVAGKESE